MTTRSSIRCIALVLIAALAVAGCAAPHHAHHAQHGDYAQHHAKHHGKHHGKHGRHGYGAVRRTLVAMVNAIDAKQWDAALAQFDDTVFVDYESLNGRPGAEVAAAALVGGWAELLHAADTHHMLTNFAVDIDGDFAETYTHVYASHDAADSGIEGWDVYGRYHHQLRRTDDGWKIIYMRLIVHGQKGNRDFLQQLSQ